MPPDFEDIDGVTIRAPEEWLVTLKSRLNGTQMTQSFLDTNFEYGFRSEVLKTVIEHWATKYDWRKAEEVINKKKHFKTQIEGLGMHYY